MKFLSSLNIYKKMNDGEISIGKISIIGALLIVLIDTFLSPTLSNIFLKLIFNFIPKGSLISPIIVFIGEFCGATLALYLICYGLKRMNRCRTKIVSNVPSSGFYYAALLVIGFRVFFEGSLSHLTRLIPMPEAIVEAFEKMNNISPIYLILAVCVFAPFVEEFMFRGILLNGFLNKYSPKTAIILSSIFFAIAHLNIPQGINAFILGLVLATVYYKTRSLYLCIFMHFINNFCAQFIFMIPLGTIFIIIQSILFIIIGLYLIYHSLKGLKIII